MISYRLTIARLVCATLFFTHVIMPMDTNRQTSTKENDNDVPENIFFTTPLPLKKPWPWHKKLWMSLVLIAKICRCCSNSENEYDDVGIVSTSQLDMIAPNVSAEKTTFFPPSDTEGIEQHYRDSKKRLENAFSHAPQKAKDLLDMIKFPDLYREKVRIMVLYGPPGVAKSTLARAIAYKAGWFLELITGRQIRAKYRGETSINLQRKLESVAHKKQNTIIVIDEINRLFEQYNSSRHDTGDTAEDFWTFLDDQRKNKHLNKHLYIIGTTNHVDKLPPQIVSRLRNRFIKVSQPSTLDDVCRDFARAITEYHALSLGCNATFLQTLLAPLYAKKCNIRDFESIEESAIRIARRTDKLSPKLTFTPIHLQEALKDILDADIDTNYGVEKLSDEDQNQENHREHMRQQRTLHTETLQFQKDQFIKGLGIQRAMQTNQKSKSSGGGINLGTSGVGVNYSWNSGINNESSNDESITNHLSDEEIRIYRQQLNIAELRNREYEQVKQLFEPLKVSMDTLAMARQQLASVSNKQARALVNKINAMLNAYTTCYNKFTMLKAPSTTELETIRQSVVALNQRAQTIKNELEAYTKQYANNSGCTIS